MRCMASVVLVAALAGSPYAVSATESIYATLQSFRVQDGSRPDVETVVLHRVKVDAAPNGGQRVIVRPIWTEYQVTGHEKSRLSDLDQREPGIQPMLDALASGFQTTVSVKGDAQLLEPVDLQGWKRVVAEWPDATQGTLSGEHVLTMLPRPVPDRWTVGQTLRRTSQSETHGTIAVEQKVVMLTPTVAVMEFSLRGNAIRGKGRQAVRRSDGMPVETRTTLHRETLRGLPATVEVSHVADLAYEPFLEPMTADQYRQQMEDVNRELSRPPYSAPSGRPSDYKLNPVMPAQLDEWMVTADMLPAFEKSLHFTLLPWQDTGRSTLAIGATARLGPPSPVSAVLQPTMTARLRSVSLLGRDGEPVPGLEAVPTLISLQMEGNHQISEASPSFPFRLPFNTTEQQRQALHRIRMTVDVEVHHWVGTEVIAPGDVSKLNPGVRISMSAPHRITLLNERRTPAAPKGIFTEVVPLDAEGQEIRTRSMAVHPFHKKVGSSDLPLVWEFSAEPFRDEITAERPIAALELRHYGWDTLRREWELRRADEDVSRWSEDVMQRL